MKNTNLIKSLFHAVCGLRDAFRRERNLRIHISVAVLIYPFAYAYELNRIGFAVLTLTVTLVICAELLNSGIEKAVDTATRDFRFNAKHSKDFAAAATLVSAIGAIAIGFFLFGDLQRIWETLKMIFTSLKWLALFAALFFADVFVLFYPKFIKRHLKQHN